MRDIRLRDKFNTLCLICGRWYYGRIEHKCPRCGGHTRAVPDREMAFMARNGMYEVERRKREL